MLGTHEARKRRQATLAAQAETAGIQPDADLNGTLATLKAALLGQKSVPQNQRKLPDDNLLRSGRGRNRRGTSTGIAPYMTHESALAVRVAELEAELKRKYETAIAAAQSGGVSLKAIEQAAIASLTDRTSAREVPAAGARKASLASPMANRRAASLLCKGDFWIVGYQGEESLIKHGKGLCHISYLLRYPDREIHTLDLIAYSGAYRRSEQSEAATRELSGGATLWNDVSAAESFTVNDEVLDRQARAAFRAQLVEIEEALERAKRVGDEERAVALEHEADTLKRELVRTIGPCHRVRRLEARTTERARLNVTRGIWTAVSRIERAAPALGQHLGVHIRTGLYCRYQLDHAAPIDWNL